MKKCVCKARSKNHDELKLLIEDLEKLDRFLKPYQVGDEVIVEFDELLLVPLVVDVFEEFDEHSVFIEF